MRVISRTLIAVVAAVGSCVSATTASASPFFFSTGNATNLIATASRPGPSSGVDLETESADDFVLTTSTRITSLSFIGLLPADTPISSIDTIVAEIYRVFPSDSDVGRTSGPPVFSTPQVPTRVNSPSDVAFVSRDSTAGELTFTTTLLGSDFTANNSVDTGINPVPGQTTGGEGSITGQQVRFDVTLTTPFDLSADHYFLVPQVLLTDPDQHFLWLSAERPITTGTPFAPDLQAWARNAELDPDWLRIGTDIVGAGTINLAFTLDGETVSAVPEPATNALLILGMAGLGIALRRKGRNPAGGQGMSGFRTA